MPEDAAVESKGLTLEEAFENGRQSEQGAAKGEEKATEEKDEAQPDKSDEQSEEQSADESKEQEGAEKAGEEAKDDEKPIGLWDKDRQREQQEAANERKALEAKVAALETKLSEVSAKAQEKADKSGDADDAAKADALADIEKQANEMLAGIDEDANAEKLSKALKGGMTKLFEALKAVKAAHGDSRETRELKSKLEGLEKQLGEAKEAEAAKNRSKAESDAVDAQRAHIVALDKKYGEKLHNAAIRRAQEKMEAEGYSDKRRPSLAASKAFLDAAYAEVALEKGVKAAPAKNTGPRPDTGTGGRSPNTNEKLRSGSLDSVMDQLRKQLNKK